MDVQAQILARLAYLKAELEALTRLVELSSMDGPAAPEAPAPTTTASAPAPAKTASAAPEAAPEPDEAPEPEEASEPEETSKKKVRWRYVPGTWYRIVGENPFRNGNNYNLFEYLSNLYGNQPFSRAQLGEAIGTLAKNGKIDSVQGEDTFVMVFLRTAGATKGRIEMADPPADGPIEPAVDPKAALPPEPGEVAWKLVGSPSFHTGSINDTLWKALEGTTFSRDSLAELAEDLKKKGELDSARSGAIIARDFLGLVADRGLAEKA